MREPFHARSTLGAKIATSHLQTFDSAGVNGTKCIPPMQCKSGIWRTDRSMERHQLAEYSALRVVIGGITLEETMSRRPVDC